VRQTTAVAQEANEGWLDGVQLFDAKQAGLVSAEIIALVEPRADLVGKNHVRAEQGIKGRHIAGEHRRAKPAFGMLDLRAVVHKQACPKVG
jgi:hypothetical protein